MNNTNCTLTFTRICGALVQEKKPRRFIYFSVIMYFLFPLSIFSRSFLVCCMPLSKLPSFTLAGPFLLSTFHCFHYVFSASNVVIVVLPCSKEPKNNMLFRNLQNIEIKCQKKLCIQLLMCEIQ